MQRSRRERLSRSPPDYQRQTGFRMSQGNLELTHRLFDLPSRPPATKSTTAIYSTWRHSALTHDCGPSGGDAAIAYGPRCTAATPDEGLGVLCRSVALGYGYIPNADRPFSAHTQPRKAPTIGVLVVGSPGSEQFWRCAHRALGLVLLRHWIAEQRHPAVTKLLGDFAAHLRNCCRRGIKIGTDQFAPVLGIEPGSQCRSSPPDRRTSL